MGLSLVPSRGPPLCTPAHCMGGCAMADSLRRGAMDVQNRVFGHQNMLVCDGSMPSANLGVNPSLTLTALTEHAMSHIPAKATLEATPPPRTLNGQASFA